MDTLTNNDVLDFIRLLTNLGNVYHLNETNMTIERSDGQQLCVSEGDKIKPIQILFNGMVRDNNYALLNPFKMVEGNNPALTMFYQTRFTVISVLVKKILVRLAEIGYTKEIDNYDNVGILSAISENCDKTLVDELNKVNASDYFRIFYNKKTKTAEAQTIVFSDLLESQYKMRKRTYHLIPILFRKVFDIPENDNTMSKYMYRATILSIPELDAKLHVLGQILKVIGPLSKSLLNTDLQEDEFEKHLKNLDAYSRMYSWFTSKVSSDNNISVMNNQSQGVLPSAQQTAPAWTAPAMPSAAPAVSNDPNPIPITAAMPVATPPPPPVPVAMPMAQATPIIPVAQPMYGVPAIPGNQLIQPMTFMPQAQPYSMMGGMYNPPSPPVMQPPSTAEENIIPIVK